MGIINDMKKLLFGAKAVGKSAAEKTGEAVKEASEELAERAGETFEKAKYVAEDIGDKILTTGEKVYDSAKSYADEILTDERVEKAKEVAEKVGEKVISTSEEALKTLKGAADKASEKFQDFFEKAQEEAAKEEADSTIVRDAKKTVEDTTARMDEFTKKAQESADEVPKKPYANLEKSELTGKDDFFSKAQRFSEGDYHDQGKPKEEGTMSIIENPEENSKKDPQGEIKGFEDHDGDGDFLIDDAIIDDEK
jgi:vacuolar-type H+-ATPase subunit H